jgi:hypothetical protein
MNGRMTRLAHAVEQCLAGTRDYWHLRDSRSGISYEVNLIDTGEVRVVYRGFMVASIYGPTMNLYCGAWHTITTKRVINAALIGAGAKHCPDCDTYVQVYQRKGEWYVDGLGIFEREFADGMEVIR